MNKTYPCKDASGYVFHDAEEEERYFAKKAAAREKEQLPPALVKQIDNKQNLLFDIMKRMPATESDGAEILKLRETMMCEMINLIVYFHAEQDLMKKLAALRNK